MIDSPANPTVKLLHSLTSARARARSERGEFVAEGVRLVEDGLKAGFRPTVCLYNRPLLERAERGRLLLRQVAVLERSGSGDAIVEEASERALAAAADTLHPQGIVAAFAIPSWDERVKPQKPQKRQASALVLVCDNIQDPGNLGTILRSAEAAGVHSVWLTPRCVDGYNPKVVRAAMGAHFRLPLLTERDWPAIEAGLTALGVPLDRLYCTEASAARTYDQVNWCDGGALVVSNEAHGLSEAARQMCMRGGGAISIPMVGGTESLNAATAASVILFEAARQRRSERRST